MSLVLDTTGNLVMRRMGVWVDTAHVTQSPEGYARVSQKMMMDMKIGGMSTSMVMRTEIDCGGRRTRVTGMDSMTASMKGVPMPDSVARQAAQQSAQKVDTAWRAVPEGAGAQAVMLTAVCARSAALGSSQPSVPQPATPRPDSSLAR
jgi:hypothetical protein